MNTRADRIEHLLTAEFSPTSLVVLNESDSHRGHAGDDGTGETHFRVCISSCVFSDLSRVRSHRLINEVLKSEFESGLHALAIEIK